MHEYYDAYPNQWPRPDHRWHDGVLDGVVGGVDDGALVIEPREVKGQATGVTWRAP